MKKLLVSMIAFAIALPHTLFATTDVGDIDQIDLSKPAEELTIDIAIQKALRNSPDMINRRLTQEMNEISYANSWDTMFMPNLSAGFNASNAYTLTQIPRSAAAQPETTDVDGMNNNARKGQYNRGTPTSGYSFIAASYTLFNFGKDRDQYEAAKMTFERSKQTMKEFERQLRVNVIKALFNLKTSQDLLEISKRTVESAELIVQLVKSRIPLGKAKDSDLSSAQMDLLTARNQLIVDMRTFQTNTWAMNQILGDPIDKLYKVNAKVAHEPFAIGLEKVLAIYKENNPTLKDAKVSLEQARITARLARKNILPLPTVTLTGATIGHTFGTTKSSMTRTSNSDTSGNIDVVAALSFSIPLYGSGGFLNQRTLRLAEISEEMAEITYRTATNSTDISIRTAYRALMDLEASLANTEKLYKESLQVFDASLANIRTNANYNRLDLRDAITALRTNEQALTNAVLSHYNSSLDLLVLLGLDSVKDVKQ